MLTINIRIKILGNVHKKEKIESIPNKGLNIGQKFINYFQRKNNNNKIPELDNKNEHLNEINQFTKTKFDTKTTDDINYNNNYFSNNLDEKDYNFSEIFKKMNSLDPTRNLGFLKSERSCENNINIVDDYKEKIYFNSNTNFSNFKKMESKAFFKKNPEHFIQRVKERVEKLNKF